jgi:hypothetical protein
MRAFLDWLAFLPQKYRRLSREIYTEKHGHPPEEFEIGEPTPRCDGVYAELDLDEDTLKKYYPKPISHCPNTEIIITPSKVTIKSLGVLFPAACGVI